MVREYRHVKMLKRAGRGHESTGAMGTQPGGCAVLCPACPQPGLNLPNGWEDAPEETRYVHYYFSVQASFMTWISRFLYSLFLAIDANFRLKRKAVSSDMADPGLCNGLAYFVEKAITSVF